MATKQEVLMDILKHKNGLLKQEVLMLDLVKIGRGPTLVIIRSVCFLVFRWLPTNQTNPVKKEKTCKANHPSLVWSYCLQMAKLAYISIIT